jgi:hypothetical protein
MSDTIALPIWIILFWFITMLTPEFAGQVVRDYQIKEVKEYAVQQISDNGGYTTEVASKINNKMLGYGLNPNWLVVKPDQKINWNEEFKIVIKGTYTYRSFNLLGTGIGNYTVDLKDEGTGTGHVYYR